MSSNKKTKSKFNFIIICIIGFVVSIFFEFYFINYFPYDYFMLFGTGIIMCIFGYLSIDGVLEIINQTSRKRNEQNEIMIKASKAIYLTTKKIALNSHSMPDTLETPKDFGSLIDDLSQANERLAKEIENAVSLQSLVQKNRTIVNNAREIIENHEQPLSPLEVEKDLKLDEAISETDFETVTQPETIDSMIKQEVSSQEMAIQEAAGMTVQKEGNTETPVIADILEETIEAVGNIIKESDETPKQVSDTSNSNASEQISDAVVSQTAFYNQIEPELSSETASDIFSEVKEAASHILNNPAEKNTSEENINTTENSIIGESNFITESNITVENNIVTEDNNPAKSSTTEHTIITENNITTENNVTAIDNIVTKDSNLVENNTAESNIVTEKSNLTENNTVENNIVTENNIITESSETEKSNVASKDGSLAETNRTSEKAETAKGNIAAVNNETGDSSKIPASEGNTADKPMTSEEIAALFANL
ncbi:MAG: hypothetical protein HFH65_08245 [Lachnospiraceae bacterium]|nr:hypothetical protein [Lachnospiraceae bacterium]